MTSIKNPKYNRVTSTIDTGSSVTSIQRKKQEQNYAKGKDEIFKRIRTKTLAKLLSEEGWEEEEKENKKDHSLSTDPWKRPDTASELMQNQEGNLNSTEKKLLRRSYLLLDVRLLDQYELCKVVGAKHYPYTMLSRSVNEFTSEIHSYKNKADCYIIVYDEDEVIASKVATTMFQKGIDNVYLLSGGLKDMSEKYPEYVIGRLPIKPGTASKKDSSSRPVSSFSSTSSKSGTTSSPVRKTPSSSTSSVVKPSTASSLKSVTTSSRPLTRPTTTSTTSSAFIAGPWK